MPVDQSLAITPPESPRVHPGRAHRPHPLVRFLIRQRFARDREYLRTTHAAGQAAAPDDLVDFLFLTEADAHSPAEAFARLRWGGQAVMVSRDQHAVQAAARAFATWRGGDSAEAPPRPRGSDPWIIEQSPACIKKYPLNLRLLGICSRLYYFAARKMALIEPGRSSDRFTYNVFLARNPEGFLVGSRGNQPEDAYQVVKEVPTTERVLARLQEKFPEADLETLKRRARKFTDKIFPVFLTRETAMLKLLQRDLPERFRDRVPRALSVEQDARGYSRTLRLNWLRNGGRAMSQLEFARQSAELLAALHDDARVMHLDLRLDNFVITERGVGFVDFGSAVRVGEAFPEASLLSNLFGEMMRTSQIQRMLGKMSDAGQVTSQEIVNSYHRVDKAVDFFYLAVQINNPHTNPDFRGLVKFDKNSREAAELSALTAEILRPSDTQNARFKSAREILEGILAIEKKLGRKPSRR